MQPIMNIGVWVSLPNEVRIKIRSVFNIPRSGNVSVLDGKIETDGTTFEDFQHLTIEKMQEYTGEKHSDFYKLFDKVLAKINEEMNPIGKVDVIPPVIEVKKKVNAKKK